MTSVTRTLIVEKPVQVVWDYLSDFTNSTEWDPPTVVTERTGGDGGIGTTYRNVSGFFGAKTEVAYTVTAYEERERFQLEGDGGSVQVRDTLTFASTPSGGSSVTYHAEFMPQGVAKLSTPVLPVVLKLLADKVVDSLQEKLDAL